MTTLPLRKTPFNFYENGKKVSDPQITHEELLKVLPEFRKSKSDLIMFIRAYIQERTPAAFASQPMLWEAVREWLAGRLGVHSREIGLSGSAQSGFSAKPEKFGVSFNPNSSDLDLFIVNENFLEKISKEIKSFISKNDNQNSQYKEQVNTVKNQFNRFNYVDLNQIPANHTEYPIISKARNDTSILIDRLKCHEFNLKPSHLRIYKNWKSLGEWVDRSYSPLT